MRLNNLQIIGRIGQDARIVDHQGRKFVAFSVAVDESYKDANGTKVERVIWYDCASEQERFFKVVSYLQKGREVFVEGKPSARTYEKEGKTYSAIRIQIGNISLGALATGAGSAPAPAPAPVAAPAPGGSRALAGFNPAAGENDLPF